MSERSKHGGNTQNACRRWAEAVRDHHPTVMHFYMHQGGAHTQEAYEEGGEPDQVCDTVLELGNNRAGRIKRRVCWMTKGEVNSETKWKTKRWRKPTTAARTAGQKNLERKEIERQPNHSLTAQLVAAEHFAQVMRHRRPQQEKEARPLAALTTGAAGATVKAERSVRDRAKRQVVADQLKALCEN